MATASDNRLLVWAIVASGFAPPFMFSGVAVALPGLSADLGAGAVSLGLVETLFLAGQLAFLLPVGRLADAADKRTLFKFGLLGFGASSLLIGALSWLPAILGLRFLQGVCGAVFSATGPALLAELVPAERRGRAYGSAIGAAYAGLTLGPVVAGVLSDAWGWRAVFFAGAALLGGMFALVHALVPSAWRRPERGAHVPSTALVVAAVLCLVGGSATLRVGGLGWALLGLGVALGAWFLRLQRRLAHPLVDVAAVMRNRVLRNTLLVQLLLYMNAFTASFMLSIFMQISLGHPAKTSGQVLAIGSVWMAVVAPLSGRLAERVPARVVLSAGVAAVLCTTLLATTLGPDTSLWFLAGMLTLQGIGFGLFSSPNMTLMMNSVPASEVGMASALGSKVRSLGMVVGMLMTAVLISLRIGDEPIAEHPGTFLEIMRASFTVLAGVTAAALVASVVLRAPAAAER